MEGGAKTAIEGITDLRNRLSVIVKNSRQEGDVNTARERLKRWKDQAVRFLKENVSLQESERLRYKRTGSIKINDPWGNLEREAGLYDGLLKALLEEIEYIPSVVRPSASSPPDNSSTEEGAGAAKTDKAEQCIFIGHGRSPIWARLQIFLENELGLRSVNYESESRVGDSIVSILEKMLSQATFAVLILTAEDETAVGEKRARQNVIHEAGLFQGRLGFRRAVLLRQEGTEEFSNIAGLQHLSFSGDRIEQSFYELRRVLKREGVIQ